MRFGFTGTRGDAVTQSETPRCGDNTLLPVLLGLAEELARSQAEGACDSLEIRQREIFLTTLDSADVRTMHLRTIREDFLRESRGTPASLHYVAKSDLQWPHARTVCACKSQLHIL